MMINNKKRKLDNKSRVKNSRINGFGATHTMNTMIGKGKVMCIETHTHSLEKEKYFFWQMFLAKKTDNICNFLQRHFYRELVPDFRTGIYQSSFSNSVRITARDQRGTLHWQMIWATSSYKSVFEGWYKKK